MVEGAEEGHYGTDLYFSSAIRDLDNNQTRDFMVSVERDNLRQALVHRMATRQGELSFHPLYGSKLYRLIGKPNIYRIHKLAELYVEQCVRQEPRVSKITSITVEADTVDKNYLNIEVEIIPTSSSDPLNLVYKYFLSGLEDSDITANSTYFLSAMSPIGHGSTPVDPTTPIVPDEPAW